MPVDCVTVTVPPASGTDQIWHIKQQGAQYAVKFRDTRSGEQCWMTMGYYATYSAANTAGMTLGLTKVADTYPEVC